MRDRLTKERRSWNMSRIRGKNTSPEIAVRKLLHRMGYFAEPKQGEESTNAAGLKVKAGTITGHAKYTKLSKSLQ